ncbi:MAG TPA: leucine-rich repeat domain-containing protein [Polyangiaceae bacterium]|jgi:hypothetical protein
MCEVYFRWGWLAALLIASTAGCGKIARDDLVGPVLASAGMSSAGEGGSGGVSSGGAPSPALASGGEADCGPLIDDLETGTGHICTGNGRIGVWYAFNDETGDQWPAPTTPGVPIATSVIPGGRGASTRAIHTFGKGFTGWGVGVGLDFVFDGLSYGTFDASAFDGIRFWARSDGLQKLRVRIGTRATKLADYGGTCPLEPCSPHARDFDLGPDWVELSLPFNDLPQIQPHAIDVDFTRDELTHLQFMPQTQPFDFWIDDVRFYRDRHCCSPPAAGCQGVIEFPDPELEDRVRRSAGKRQGDLRCDDVCDVSPLARSLLAEPRPIADLTGLQCLLGLTRLDLPDNQVTELGPLASLAQLTWIDLDDNQIQDLTPLSGLPALLSLSVRKNRIESLAGLSNLPSLVRLSVDDNRLTDVSPAATLTALTSLSANRDQLVDVRALTALPSLNMLLVESNPLEDLGQFLEFPSLTYVDLAGSPERCTAAETDVVQALLARSVGVSYGNTGNAATPCVLP